MECSWGWARGHFGCPLWVESGPGQVGNLALRVGGKGGGGHMTRKQVGWDVSRLLWNSLCQAECRWSDSAEHTHPLLGIL